MSKGPPGITDNKIQFPKYHSVKKLLNISGKEIEEERENHVCLNSKLID